MILATVDWYMNVYPVAGEASEFVDLEKISDMKGKSQIVRKTHQEVNCLSR